MGDVRMLVALVRTNRIQGAGAENTNYGAEDIGLLEVNLDEFDDVFLYKSTARRM